MSHTSWRFSLSQTCVLLLVSQQDYPLLITIDLYLKSSDTIILTAFVIELFISCNRVLEACALQWSQEMSSCGLDSEPVF
jgi:hypothetical protein